MKNLNQNIIEAIKELKVAKNAVILAHYYQNPEIQEISDFVGDSFALSKIAKETTADLIIFCGVHFMGETAKILSPDKKVYMANSQAGCYLADCINESDLKKYLDQNPQTKVIAYVNTTAAVKALADVCVTSSNAVKIIRHFRSLYPNDPILYLPDQNLARYADHYHHLDLKIWPGYCDIHHQLAVSDIVSMRLKHPQALVLTHPEAPLEVVLASDFVGSTADILNYVKNSDNQEFIIGTELGILHPLKKANPDKSFYPLSDCLVCQSMKLTTLDDLYNTLKNAKITNEVINDFITCNEIIIDNQIIKKAQKSLELMLELGSK